MGQARLGWGQTGRLLASPANLPGPDSPDSSLPGLQSATVKINKEPGMTFPIREKRQTEKQFPQSGWVMLSP